MLLGGAMKIKKIFYENLNGRQKEIYNFQIVAAELAKYGFNCIKLTDDWNGADFLAYHYEGKETLKVQLKSRLTVAKKYKGNEIYIAFPVKSTGHWYLIEHDRLIEILEENVGVAGDEIAWDRKGVYHTSSPNAAVRECLEHYKL